MSPVDYQAFIARIKGDQKDLPVQTSPDASAQPPAGANAAPMLPAFESDSQAALGTKLEKIADKALDNSERILDLPVDPNEDYGHVLRAKTSVITTVLNTQAKVDETRLRRQSMDRLPGLLKLVNATAARLPPAKEPVTDGDDNET